MKPVYNSGLSLTPKLEPVRSLTFLLTLSLLLLLGCSGDSLPAKKLPADPAQALRLAQENLREWGGYRLRFEQSNFILPQWGGVDAGVIEVNRDATTARAVLTRTGEPGATYTITMSGGQTYFQRSTCQETFRIPGGGPDVLRPLLLFKTNSLRNVTDAQWSGSSIHAVVVGLGPVEVLLDEKGRPKEVRGTSNGQPLVWRFEAWGVNPGVSAPPGSVQDRGPGGIPC